MMAEEAAAAGGGDCCRDEYYRAECKDLDEETLKLLRRNDASLSALEVNFGAEDRCAKTVDWAKEVCIADSSYLRKLAVTTAVRQPQGDWKKSKEKLRSFCEAIAHNESIYHLELRLRSCPFPMRALAPFIENNGNLRTLAITGYSFFGPGAVPRIDTESIQLLTSALANRGNKESLKRFEMSDTNFKFGHDRPASVELMTTLGHYRNLHSLSLGGNKMDSVGCDALKGLRKLEYLDLSNCSIGTAEACALSNALIKNKAIKKLILDGNRGIERAGWEALGAVWARPNCILEELHLDDCVCEDDCSIAIAGGLAKNSTLKVLSLDFIEESDIGVSTSGWQAFFNRLKNASFPLEKVFINGNDIGKEGAPAMVNFLSRMTTLKVIEMQRTENCWEALPVLLRSDGIRLTELDLGNNLITGDEALAFAYALEEQTSLEVLDLRYCLEASTPAEGMAFFGCIQHLTSLVKLDLGLTDINDEAATILANALASHAKLKELNLESNDFSAAIFSTVLRNPNSVLESLDLSGTMIDDAGALALAEALAGNTTLRTLLLDLGRVHNENDTTTQVGKAAFTKLLGNDSSLLDTFNSNHTLQKMDGILPDELVTLLRLNRMSNKNEVARQKILMFHFSGEDISIQAFAGMDLTVLPRALAWAGRDDAGHSLLYKLVRGLPSLVECGDGTKSAVAGKRKRI